MSGPWTVDTRPPAVAEPAAPATAAKAARQSDVETALGTRWAVWVGGIALALGGLFLIRYTIEAGIFGPGVRLTMAAVLGLVLVAAGEFIRRTGFKVPVQGVAGAYIPAILTAAGAFILFGTVYAAYGVYGFIGPALAFTLLGAIGIATIAAALVHGQALAGIGLVGAMVTPMLIASQAPNPWALFGYLAIVLAATGVIARMRDWTLLMAAAFVGTGIWTIVYMTDAPGANLSAILFIDAVTLAVLAFVWLGRRGGEAERARASTGRPSRQASSSRFRRLRCSSIRSSPPPAMPCPAPCCSQPSWRWRSTGRRRWRFSTPPGWRRCWSISASYRRPPSSSDFSGGSLGLDGLPVAISDALTLRIGIALALVFIGAGFWAARRFAASAPVRAASWAAWGVLAPLVILLALWLTFGNLDRDLVYAALAALLVVVFAAGGEWIARGEEPPLRGGAAVSFALGGAAIAGLLMLHMAFGSGWTTVLLGAAAVVPALATRWRSYPVLGWISVGAVIAVLGRVAFDPTIVGAEFLSKTPVFNWLLPGYGVPALAFGFAAWQLARTTNGRPRLAMEAAASLFALAHHCHAGAPRHAWRRHRLGCADAGRTGDLYADRHRRRRHPGRHRHAFAELGAALWLDSGRRGLGRLHRRPAFRGAEPALHRRIDRPDPGVQPVVPCLSLAGGRQPEGWRSMPATSGRNGMRRCWRWSRHCLPSPMRRCRSGGCSRANSSACGAALASSKPTLIPRCGWSSAWRCSLPASG